MVDRELLKDAVKILKSMGIDISSAMNLYLHQIIITETIPFQIKTGNGFTA